MTKNIQTDKLKSNDLLAFNNFSLLSQTLKHCPMEFVFLELFQFYILQNNYNNKYVLQLLFYSFKNYLNHILNIPYFADK